MTGPLQVNIRSREFGTRMRKLIDADQVCDLRRMIKALEPAPDDSGHDCRLKQRYLGEVVTHINDRATLVKAIRYLGQRSNASTDKLLAIQQAHSSPFIRKEVVANMSTAGSRHAVICLGNLARDVSVEVREWVAFMLGQMALRPSTRACVSKCLKSLAQDPCNRVKVNAIRALIYQGISEDMGLLHEYFKKRRIDLDSLCDVFVSLETQFINIGLDEEIADGLVELVRGKIFPLSEPSARESRRQLEGQ